MIGAPAPAAERPPPLPPQVAPVRSAPPPLALAYAPPATLLQRQGAKFAALAAFATSGAWLLFAPEGYRLLGTCALFPAVFLAVLRWSGAATRVAFWAWCLVGAGMLPSLSDRLCAAAAFSLDPTANYFDEYVVLPEWRWPLALLSFAWLPPFVFVLARGGISFEHAGVRREVVPFVLVMGLLFSIAHPLAFVFESAIGGVHRHLQTVTSPDGRYRAEVYQASWLGEDRYFAYLCDPSPAPIFGRRIQFHGAGYAVPFSLVPTADGSSAEIRASAE